MTKQMTRFDPSEMAVRLMRCASPKQMANSIWCVRVCVCVGGEEGWVGFHMSNLTSEVLFSPGFSWVITRNSGMDIYQLEASIT